MKTSRRICLFAFWLCLILYSSRAYTAERPTAVLTGFEGKVVVVQSDGEKKAEPGMSLHSGAVVGTGKAASAYVLFDNGEMKVVEENSRYKVEAARGVERTHLLPSHRETKASIDEFKYVMVKPGYGFGVEEGQERLIYPRDSIASRRPAFIWEPEEKACYGLEVLDDKGKSILKSEKANPPFSYPEGAPDLKFGRRYQWKLTWTFKDGKKGSRIQPFTIVNKRRHARLERTMGERLKPNMDKATRLFVKGLILSSLEFYADAALVYRQYTALYPKAEYPARELAICYDRIGLVRRAGEIAKRFEKKSGVQK